MKQLVTFFILTIIFYYTTLFLGRCISSEYKKIKVREFVEGFEELSKGNDKKEKGEVVEGMRGRRRRGRRTSAQTAKLIGAIATAATAKKIAAEAKVTEAEAKKQEAINEGKEKASHT